MRKVEMDMVKAIREGKNFNSDNTFVEWLPRYSGSPSATHDAGHVARVYLFGNMIAEYYPSGDNLHITDSGHRKNTTKSRLNALLSEFANGYKIYQQKHVWYCNGDVWNSTAVFIRGLMV